MATTKIKIKQSSVPGNIPAASQLDQGELALNTADKKLFSKDSAGTVFEVSGGSGGGGASNIDGGVASSNYGATITIDGGNA